MKTVIQSVANQQQQQQMQECIKNLGSGTKTLMISNEETEDIMKIFKSLENPGLLLKGVTDAIQNEAKQQKGKFLSMLLSTLGASLLANMLASDGVIAASQGQGINRNGYGMISAGYANKEGKGILRTKKWI